jgi:hypothetical protein
LTHWFTNTDCPVRRPVGKKVDHGRFRPQVEALATRVMPAVTAMFTAAGATLRVVGDALDNVVVVSRDAAGTILVNGGAVAIQGGQPTVANTRLIMINGGAGNDNLSLDETNGALPMAAIFGGNGNDVLVGGSGDDFFDGGPGSDTALMGAGDDTFEWKPGDGSDVVEGQGGFDALFFNGTDAAGKFDLSADGTRARFTRDVGNVAMDLGGIEEIDLFASGGADTITVDDQSTTGLNTFNLDLSSAGTGDGQTDTVIINGTNGSDFGQIRSVGTHIDATVSAIPVVHITGTGPEDTLAVNMLGGNDTVDASNLAAGQIKLTVAGGTGNDTILGSQGGDTFLWNPGDGSDTINGQAGLDKLTFTGSDAAEAFVISPSGSHVRLTSDVGNVTMDLSAVEGIELGARGGADTIILDDLTRSGLINVQVDLGGPAGGADGQADSVVVNGTSGDDAIRVGASGNMVLVDGLVPVVITGSDGTTDHLTINTQGGNDTVDTSGLPVNLIALTVNLGDGQATVATTTTLRASTATAAFGQAEVLTATVNSAAGAPIGSVTFLDGGTVLGTATLSAAGEATLVVSLGVGTHVLTASFARTGGITGSSSAAVAVAVDRAATTLALGSSVNPAVTGKAVTFTATVAAVAPGVGTPGGTVTFFAGNKVVARVTLHGNGQARIRRFLARAGRFPIRAFYSGDAHFAASSQSLTVRVQRRLPGRRR